MRRRERYYVLPGIGDMMISVMLSQSRGNALISTVYALFGRISRVLPPNAALMVTRRGDDANTSSRNCR